MKDIFVTEHQSALDLARSGHTSQAIEVGEQALNTGARDAGLAFFVGVLCCRNGEVHRGIGHLRKAVTWAPGESMAKIELARALLVAGQNDEAAEIVRPHTDMATPAGREMTRIAAKAALNAEQSDAAAGMFKHLTEADSADFESWDGLSAALLATGDASGAVEASARSTSLRPTAVSPWLNAARAYTTLSDFGRAADAARRALALRPDDMAARVELARAHAGAAEYELAEREIDAALAAGEASPGLLIEIADLEFTIRTFDRAEQRYRRALEMRPDFAAAWVGLANLYERTNRPEDAIAALDRARDAGVDDHRITIARARALRGVGDLVEALEVARNAPLMADTRVPRAQLIGDLSDRLGDADSAYASFAEANALLAERAAKDVEAARRYRDQFSKMTALVTPEWYRTWRSFEQESSSAGPLFIFGFPRSGTTLIDTMLSGHPDAIVLEEEPTIDRTADRLGAVERLAAFDRAHADRLRQFYFDQVKTFAGDVRGRLIVDKNPLGLSSTPMLHRLFPEARFVFVERHPCDVVLSCFITAARLNAEVGSFYDLVETAKLYDAVLTYWTRCETVLPLQRHHIKYENLLADPEAALRKLADFAQLSWTPKLVQHQKNAAGRSFIASPSYAQVAEPLYNRAKGRWRRYEKHLQPVLPILRPWIEALGYAD